MSVVNPLDIRTAITQVTTALVDTLSLAYQYRYPEVLTLAALAAVDSSTLPDRALIWVASEGVVYRWHTASRLPQLVPFVIAPQALPQNGNGRWLRQSSAVTLGHAWFRPLHRVRRGYARAVQIYQGEDDAVLERIYAQRPAFLVEWDSDALSCEAYRHGAIYEYDLKFFVHCVAKNLRSGPEALIGSEVPDDAGAVPPPGLWEMIGDVRYLLGGCDLGLAPGVKFVDVTGEAKIVESELAQRLFRAELSVTVRGSVHVIDEDLISDPKIWVERRDADSPEEGGNFDRSNHVAAGYRFAPGPGLTATPTAGVAYIAGQLISSAPGAHTFEPSSDTYRDLLLDGRLVYQAVPPDEDPPPQLPSSLRIGVTRTSDTNLVGDRLLCSYLVRSAANPDDPFPIP